MTHPFGVGWVVMGLFFSVNINTVNIEQYLLTCIFIVIFSFRWKSLCCFIGNNHEDHDAILNRLDFLRFRSVSFSFNWWRIRSLSVNGGQLTGNVIWKGSSQKFSDFFVNGAIVFDKVSFANQFLSLFPYKVALCIGNTVSVGWSLLLSWCYSFRMIMYKKWLWWRILRRHLCRLYFLFLPSFTDV
jgi:hypothetical protein